MTLTQEQKNYSKEMADKAGNASGAYDGIKSAADWIKKAADEAVRMLDFVRGEIPKIPPILLLCRLKYLPGMSALTLAANIIQELSNRGYIMETNFDGSKNCIVEFIEVISKEVVDHIKDCAKVSNVMVTPAGLVEIDGKVD